MKNRRLISFLSLFSLVLVLSIYYVTMPNEIFSNNIFLISVVEISEFLFHISSLSLTNLPQGRRSSSAQGPSDRAEGRSIEQVSSLSEIDQKR